MSKVNIKTYKKKLAVYTCVQNHLSNIVTNGTITDEKVEMFKIDATEAASIFDDSIKSKINEIYEKSLELSLAHAKIFQSDGSPVLPVDDMRSYDIEKETELLEWCSEQFVESLQFLENKLNIKIT
jgi:hypothetical protein